MIELDEVLALIKAMNREHVEYKLFGALALSAHGFVRATEDADFFIQPDIENIERLKKALRSVWDDPRIDEISSEELCGDYPAVAYYPREDDFHIDFVTRLGEAFTYDTVRAEPGTLGDIPIQVVTPDMLYEMKRDTVRYKDKIDAEALRLKFGWKK
jgi:hypothetical protein